MRSRRCTKFARCTDASPNICRKPKDCRATGFLPRRVWVPHIIVASNETTMMFARPTAQLPRSQWAAKIALMRRGAIYKARHCGATVDRWGGRFKQVLAALRPRQAAPRGLVVKDRCGHGATAAGGYPARWHRLAGCGGAGTDAENHSGSRSFGRLGWTVKIGECHRVSSCMQKKMVGRDGLEPPTFSV